ncbi:hypothetical protein A1Q2_07055 [Trichosporon asahii var. asahii CBS 8904]|uniref:Uncharacterized protein n=1 Tax=Trichosporon asahii var. asahii (strain CBS 8904) TaxID=1220162 RepID=K1WAI0_TRIAC|nr:hypothetical protein A1Q2_07055 [Trichosporon asahii var. asahii CBS 8904]
MRTALSVFSPIAPAVSLVSAASLALAPSFSISSVGTVPVPLGVSIPPLLNLIPLLPRLPSQLSRTPPTKSDLHLPLLPHSILDIDKGELKGLRSRSLSVSLASEPGTRLVADPVDDFGGFSSPNDPRMQGLPTFAMGRVPLPTGRKEREGHFNEERSKEKGVQSEGREKEIRLTSAYSRNNFDS